MKKNKPLLLILLCLIFTLGSFSLNAAPVEPSSSGDITVYLNGEKIVFDQPPLIEEGRTLVPARAILEALGLKLTFDEFIGQVIASNLETEIVLYLGSTSAYIDGIETQIDVPAKIIGGRTMVPLRFIAESMDLTVGWNESTRVIQLAGESAPSPSPSPTPKPVSYFYMTDQDIRDAIEDSRRSILRAVSPTVITHEALEKLTADKEQRLVDLIGDYEALSKFEEEEDLRLYEIMSTAEDYQVITPHFAIVKNPYPRSPLYTDNDDDLYENTKITANWDNLTKTTTTETYFDAMKNLYENDFAVGNKIYVYVQPSTAMVKANTEIELKKIEVRQDGKLINFLQTKDDQHTLDIALADKRYSEEEDLDRAKISIDLRNIDTEQPFEIEYTYHAEFRTGSETDANNRKVYTYKEEDRTKTITIHLKDYK
ncbi:MAG: copper amine oxidase N-terminal domain-containing protein [Clostridiales bacterium]|jgi:hypothetical protein|nr:copper amine oxidase N-terminal domain-containing protein [Clostridiales bacterium]